MNFEVSKHDPTNTRVTDTTQHPISSGEVRLLVDSFTINSTSISAAKSGLFVPGLDLFPAVDSGWSLLPVWGAATVSESGHPAVARNDRVFGLCPTTTSFVVTPGAFTTAGFEDSQRPDGYLAAHKQFSFIPETADDNQILLWPQFCAAFALCDVVCSMNALGADTVLFSSASSKTALLAAHLLNGRGVQVVGLTSANHVEFVESTHCYTAVVSYTKIKEMHRTQALFVDFAHKAEVTESLISNPELDVVFCLAAGDTHGPANNQFDPQRLKGTNFESFSHLAQRASTMSTAVLEKEMRDAWVRAYEWVLTWIQYQYAIGHQAVTMAYLELANGTTPPQITVVCSL